MHSPVLKKSFWWKKTYLLKKLYIHLFCKLGVFFVFLPTMLRLARQNFIVQVQTNFLTNKFFRKLIIFWSFTDNPAKVFRSLTRNFLARLPQLHFACPDADFFSFFDRRKEGKIVFFSKKLHCYHFQTLSEKDPVYFCRHGYGRLMKISLYVFRWKIWQIGFFWKLINFS